MVDTWFVLPSLGALLLLVALVPLRIVASGGANALERRWRIAFRVGPAWGPPVLRVRLSSARRPPRHTPSAPASAARAKRRPGLVPTAPTLGRLARAVRFEQVRLRLEIGSLDAARTAIACGTAWAVAAGLGAMHPTLAGTTDQLVVVPVYGESRLVGRGRVVAVVRLWRLAWLAAAVLAGRRLTGPAQTPGRPARAVQG